MNNKLRERRLELGLSQPEVVRRIRDAGHETVDVSLYSKFENGHCLPNHDTLDALETALQADRTALFSTDELVMMLPDEAYTPRNNAQQPNVTMLANAIPYGRRNAISREALCAKLGMSDRMVRKGIEEARAAGIIILNDQNGRGYYQSDDVLEMRRQYQQDTARAMSILKRRKPLRDALKQAGVAV